MKNDRYWRRRFELLEKALNKKGVEYLKLLDTEYRRAIAGIEKDIARWYVRLAANNDISPSEARKLLTAAELREFRWTVDEYIKRGKENAITGQWAEQLENASARVHITRFEALEIQLRNEAERLAATVDAGIRELAAEAFVENYLHTAYEIQKGLNLGWQVAVDTNRLDKVLSSPWSTDGKTFSDRIWGNKEQLINTVRSELTQALMRGDSPDNAIRAISHRFDVSKSQAGRLVMTESAYMASVSRGDCFNDLDVKRYRIVATLDILTSDICRELDGKVFDMKDYEPGVTANPFHPWCRTTTCPHFDDMYGERIARDPKTGETYYVPGDMTYDEWYEKFVVEKYGADEAAVMQKMARNETRDREQYERYRAIYSKDFPNSLEDFQRLKYTDSKWWTEIKAGKQERLNNLNYSPKLNGMFGNGEVRSWYVTHVENIRNVVDVIKPLIEQAMQAFNLRNQYRTQARSMMRDLKISSNLDIVRPNMTFEQMVQHKLSKYHLTEDAIYEDIIRSASTSNTDVNRLFGIE